MRTPMVVGIILTVVISLTDGILGPAPPKCLSIPPGMAKFPTAVVFEIMASTQKIKQPLKKFSYVEPALKYWDEIRCLSMMLTGRKNTTLIRQNELFRLQQIIKDTVLRDFRFNNQPDILPRLIQAVGLREAYGFLLNQTRRASPNLFGSTVFDIALVMKNDSGLEARVYQKVVPETVRRVLSSQEKPVYLKNEATGSYLNYQPGCDTVTYTPNCSSLVLSKKRGDEGWKFLPTIIPAVNEYRRSYVAFKLLTAKNGTEALVRHADDRYGRTDEVTRYLLSSEDDRRVTVSTFTDGWRGEPCFEEDKHGSLVINPRGLRGARLSFESGLQSARSCVKWTVTTE